MTFNGNSAKGTDSAGGAIYNLSSNPKLSNVTFSGNSAVGGAGAMFNNGSDPQLTNATFSGNSTAGGGGAMYNYGGSTPAIFDSIFWGDGIAEFLNDASSPLLTDNTVQGGCPSGATCAGVLITANPMLAPLQNNGGFTKTMALGAGSPAIDAGEGSSNCAPKDQRGVIRPQGVRCDMGAYEVKALRLVSIGTYDGQVLESGKATNIGGIANSTSPMLFVGDQRLNRRYRGILSFDTSPRARWRHDRPLPASAAKARPGRQPLRQPRQSPLRSLRTVFWQRAGPGGIRLSGADNGLFGWHSLFGNRRRLVQGNSERPCPHKGQQVRHHPIPTTLLD